jgi:alcohol dehydrogenase class IV
VQTFLFSFPTRVRFGPGAIQSVGEDASRHGRNALIVTGSTFARRSGLIDSLRGSLADSGVSASVYEGVDRNASITAIDRGSEIAREMGADLVIGLGGGSALDGAKAIAAVAGSGGSIWEYARDGGSAEPRTIEAALPIVQVPIIASTGSETSDRTVVLNERERVRAPIQDPKLYARAAVVDPTLTFTVPARYTAVGSMNIVSQMLESYLSAEEFAVTDRVTEGLMRAVMDSLPRALRRSEDLDARNNLSWAAALAPSLSLAGRDGTAPVRAMAYPLTARFDIDHGTAVAALWPSYMRYALSNRFRLPQIGRFKRYALLGRQIFGVHETDDEVAAETTLYRFVAWLRSLDMPTDLRQLGIEDVSDGDMAAQVVRVSGNGTRLPGGLGVQDIEHIYDGALRRA